MVDERPLTNADFRQLLLTPRPGASCGAGPPRGRSRQQTRRSAQSVMEQNQNSQKTVSDATYRDRALERRKGMLINDGEGLTETEIAAMQSLSYEESKLLGGDLGHTHLVKGLDYALLDRIRQEQQRKEATKVTNLERVEESTKGLQPGKDDDRHSPSKQQRFSTHVAKSLYQYFDVSHASHGSLAELFKPRRYAFIYDLGLEEKDHVPKTLVRAMGDYTSAVEDINVGKELEIIEQLTKVISYLKSSGGKKYRRGEMREKTRPHIGPPPFQTDAVRRESNGMKKQEDDGVERKEEEEEEEEEDIFADAGTDYVAERRAGPTVNKEVGPYFEQRGPKDTHGATDMQIETQANLGIMSKKEGQATGKVSTAQIRARMESNVDDGYAECYPAYYEGAEDIYDSDEDNQAQKPALNSESKAEQKRNAARETAKELSKRDAELAKIKNIFEQKGYGNEKAFEKSRREGRETSNSTMSMPSKKKRI
jgi:IK cytokine